MCIYGFFYGINIYRSRGRTLWIYLANENSTENLRERRVFEFSACKVYAPQNWVCKAEKPVIPLSYYYSKSTRKNKVAIVWPSIKNDFASCFFRTFLIRSAAKSSKCDYRVMPNYIHPLAVERYMEEKWKAESSSHNIYTYTDKKVYYIKKDFAT